MKRALLSISLAFVLVFADAQETEQKHGLFDGIIAGVNYSNFILGDMGGMKSKASFGITLGLCTKINFSEHFALQPELLLNFKNSKIEEKSSGNETKFMYFGMEIPLYAVVQSNFLNGKCFVGAGSYIGFGFDAQYKAEGKDDVNLYREYLDQKSEMQRWDFGAGVMLGYRFDSDLQIRATYKTGFINALNANKNNAGMLNQCFSVGLASSF